MRALLLGRRRSNGVEVDYLTWRMIQRGDRARAAGQWQLAARSYAQALKRDDTLGHVWLQLGHACKEACDLEQGALAYGRALDLSADAAEPLLHLGHLAKLRGDFTLAAEFYLKGYKVAPNHPDLFRELLWVLHNVPLHSHALVEAAALVGLPPSHATHEFHAPASAALYDVTDLIAFFRYSRVPTGIQRVQIELVGRLLASRTHGGSAVALVPARDGFVEIPAARLQALIVAAKQSSDASEPSWRQIVAAVHMDLAQAPALSLLEGAWLFSLSPAWSNPNYFQHVQALQDHHAVRFAPFIYDLIPLLYPDLFPADLAPRFRRWMNGLLHCANHFITISDQTARDLISFGEAEGREVDRAAVTVVPLDGDFRLELADAVDEIIPQLTDMPFVLMVSTIEPRKNHLGAFRAWHMLRRTIGEDQLPRLVCVGGKGWLNEPTYAYLRRHPDVRRSVVILHGITDEGLRWLYRTCLFTLYPSFYEGWGLPVTESLCYGKVPVVSNSGALPEAGGQWATYFDPKDPKAIADAVQVLLCNPDLRGEREAEITQCFKPRAWEQIVEPLYKLIAGSQDRRN